MTIEIRDANLEARIKKQLQATGSSTIEEVLLRLLETQEEQQARFVLAPQAAEDLVGIWGIWRYIKSQSSIARRTTSNPSFETNRFLHTRSRSGAPPKESDSRGSQILSSLFLLDRLPACDKIAANRCDPSWSTRHRTGSQRSTLISRACLPV